MDRSRVLFASAVVALGMGLAPAAAVAKPVLSLNLPQADAGSPASFAWTALHPVAHGNLVIQRQVGTARVWRTVRKLSGASGSGKLPPLQLGSYHVRIADIGPGPRHKVVAERRRNLFVFGKIPLGTLVKNLTFPPGIHTTANYTFNYVALGGVGPGASAAFTVSAAQNTCRSVHLDFDSNGETRTADTAAVSVVQQAADPQTSQAASAQVETGSFDATLTPGHSWAVNTLHPDGTGVNITVYLNGSVSCYSAVPWLRS